MEEQYNQEGVNAIGEAGKPIPGQSLTADPETKRPFESPPQHTTFKEALEETVGELLLEENYMPLMKAVSDGMPITDIALQMGYVGFREGKWNPDLMMMMLEPLMYTVMALAEKAGIKYRIDDEDDGDDEDTLAEEKTSNIAKIAKQKLETNKMPSRSLPPEIVEKIESLDMAKEESLLAQPVEEPVEEPIEEPIEEKQTNEQPSLLSKGM
tara:strand:+ start:2795 stop:3427 length:633 start_codon:yes stop_codon:yes gene_type:complete